MRIVVTASRRAIVASSARHPWRRGSSAGSIAAQSSRATDQGMTIFGRDLPLRARDQAGGEAAGRRGSGRSCLAEDAIIDQGGSIVMLGLTRTPASDERSVPRVGSLTFETSSRKRSSFRSKLLVRCCRVNRNRPGRDRSSSASSVDQDAARVHDRRQNGAPRRRRRHCPAESSRRASRSSPVCVEVTIVPLDDERAGGGGSSGVEHRPELVASLRRDRREPRQDLARQSSRHSPA